MTRQYRNDGRDQIPIENVHGNVYIQEGSRPTRSRSESLLLQAVKQEVISRLNQSLHNAVFINLGKQSQPQQVRRRLDAEVKVGSQSPEALPAETSILEVFDRTGIDRRLLILGEPGAGKTTTMLDLAKGLCDRAEQDATAFIPVLLNLSSWKDSKQTMTAWLVEELKSKYGVRKDIGTKLLAEKQLLPLLDGLDEVKPEHQESCVQAINRWLESEERPPSLTVCCRREEYETVVRGQWQLEAEEAPDETRMHLNGAILLQTLTDEQIQTYLSAANQPELWQMLRQDEALWELIKTPLWLSITLLSYEELSLNQWQQTISTEQRLALLLDAYVERMLHKALNSRRYAKRKPPTAKETRQWLIFLARQLQRGSQTEFLIEKMQPYWLQSNQQKWAYKLIGRLIVGLIVGLISGLIVGLISGLIVGLISGLIVGLISGLDPIYPVELIQISMSHVVRHAIYQQVRSSLIVGLSGGLSLGLLIGLAVGLLDVLSSVLSGVLSGGLVTELLIVLSSGLLVGLISGLIGGLLVGLIGGLLVGLKALEVDDKIYPNQGIRKSALNFLFTALIGGLTFGLLGGLFGRLGGLFVGLLGGLFVGLSKGGWACIQHFSLRLALSHSVSIPWNYARFLDYCTERLLLQRVGGRYRFIHKSLQEHFANMRE